MSASFAGSPVTLDPVTPRVSANGSWSATFTVPGSPNGPQVVTATDSGGATASTGYTTVASVTDLDPQNGTAGTTEVTIEAEGFLADRQLSVTVGGVDATIVSGGTTGTDGGSDVTFTIPAVAPGVQSVVVSDGTNTATSTAEVTVEAAGPTTTAPTTAPPVTVPQTTVPSPTCAHGPISNAGGTCADSLPPPPGAGT